MKLHTTNFDFRFQARAARSESHFFDISVYGLSKVIAMISSKIMRLYNYQMRKN